MATFPFLNLSPADSERILGSLMFGELFDLSQCSKRTYNHMKTFFSKAPDTNRLIANISTSSSYELISSRNEREVSWVFLEDRDPRIMDLEDPKTYKISGFPPMDFCINRTPTSVQYITASRLSVQDILNFGQYLLTLFNGRVRNLEMKSSQMKFLDGLVSMEAFRKCDLLRVEHGAVNHKALQKILSSFEPKEILYLSCTTKNNFSCCLPIKCDVFVAVMGSWMNLKVLLNLDCRVGYISDSPVSNEDLNKYLKTWLDGSNTKLDHITISGSMLDTSKKYDLSKIVEGIPSTPGVAKRPDATEFQNWGQDIDYATGVDLRRDSDGMLATALIFEEVHENWTFLFVVWHVPNPNLVVVP